MSPLSHASDAPLRASPIRRAIGWMGARLLGAIRGRPARLVEERMPDWQLRDLGFRDGRAAPPQTGGFG